MVVVVKVASLPRRRFVDTRRDAALRRLATADQNDDVAMVGGGGGIYHRFGRFGRRRRPLKGGRRVSLQDTIFQLFFNGFLLLFGLFLCPFLCSSSSFRFFESLNF